MKSSPSTTHITSRRLTTLTRMSMLILRVLHKLVAALADIPHVVHSCAFMGIFKHLSTTAKTRHTTGVLSVRNHTSTSTTPVISYVPATTTSGWHDSSPTLPPQLGHSRTILTTPSLISVIHTWIILREYSCHFLQSPINSHVSLPC